MALGSCRDCELPISTEARVCPRCGAPNPTEGSPRRRFRWARPAAAFAILFCLGVGLLYWLDTMGVDTETLFSNSVPLCDNAAVTGLAKKAIEDAPVAKMVGAAVFELREIREVQYDSDAKKRRCSGLAILNSGTEKINYTVAWTDDRIRQISVRVSYGE